MSRPVAFVQHINDQGTEEPHDINGLVPGLLRREEQVVMVHVSKMRRGGANAVRQVLEEDHRMLSARSMSISHDVVNRVKDYGFARYRAVLQQERLCQDSRAFLEILGDASYFFRKQQLSKPWSGIEWDELVRAVYDAVERKATLDGQRDEQAKVIATASETAEIIMGKFLTWVTQQPLLKSVSRMVTRRDDLHASINQDRLLNRGHMLHFNHESPFSCTLYRGHQPLEEYDAVMRLGGKHLAFDVTCSPNPQSKLTRDYALPALCDAEVVVVRATNTTKAISRHGGQPYVLDLPIFQDVVRIGKEVFEQCRFGARDRYIDSVRAMGWGESAVA